MIIVGVCC